MELAAALEIVAQTDPGMVRSHNEDAVLATPACGLVVLADGMGGYNAGEVASGMATAHLGKELESRLQAHPAHQRQGDGQTWAAVSLREEIARANTAIYGAAQSQAQYAGMGMACSSP